jgi:hypothetical protein
MPIANCQLLLATLPETATQAAGNKQRRWSVIVSALLIGTLAVLVTFTSRAAFLSPTAIVVVAAIGLIALLLQLRFRYREIAEVHVPVWLNCAGTVFALVGFFADYLHIRSSIAELLALFAIGCFAVSGGFVLHRLRKHRAIQK